MIGIKVNQPQLKQQLDRLRAIATKVSNTEVPNRQISVELYGFVMRNFQTEGGMTEAGGWEPLADSTLEWKERRGYKMILQNEGELRQSFQMMSARLYAGVGAQKLGPISKSAMKAAKASDKRYDSRRAKGDLSLRLTAKPVKVQPRPPDIAATHEYGSSDGRIPARPMLPSQAQALAIGMRVYERFIREAQ